MLNNGIIGNSNLETAISYYPHVPEEVVHIEKFHAYPRLCVHVHVCTYSCFHSRSLLARFYILKPICSRLKCVGWCTCNSMKHVMQFIIVHNLLCSCSMPYSFLWLLLPYTSSAWCFLSDLTLPWHPFSLWITHLIPLISECLLVTPGGGEGWIEYLFISSSWEVVVKALTTDMCEYAPVSYVWCGGRVISAYISCKLL